MNTQRLLNTKSSSMLAELAGLLIPLLIAGGLLVSVAVQAGEGHDHGEAAPSATGTASPRVTGHSDLYEIVGVVEAGVMTVYLDRYASNEPVTGARVEVEAGAAKGIAAAQADGTYRFEHAVLKQPGVLPVSFTVADKADTDLLAGDLTIGEDSHSHSDAVAAKPWLRWAGWALAALAFLSAAVFALRKRTNRAATQ